jgi:precorrin-8X/cobalt-precorrin-8 methylmutase
MRQETVAALDYMKDPQAITDASFDIVRAEADLSCLPASLESVALRMIHACGMTDIAEDLRFDPLIAKTAGAALKAGAPILADCEAVAAAITRKFLPANNEIICTLNDERTPALAERHMTTRSAAAVRLWKTDEAVVVIGNAPTALFALLELLDERAAKPAAIIATPVGFVGAAESKQELARGARGVPFVTLLGRRGGSAMAAAALNAIAREATP